MSLIQTLNAASWDTTFQPEMQNQATDAVEAAKLLLFPNLNFELQHHERKFLSPDFIDPKAKNISYSLNTDQIRGVHSNLVTAMELKNLLQRFATQALGLVNHLFPHYGPHLEIARTSFRPLQVSNRKQSYRKDDRRLHVDAFSATPNQGRRILRLFCNINPNQEPRVWRLGESFESVARQFLPQIPRYSPFISRWLERLKLTKSYRSEYDHLMLNLHDHMKKNLNYQQQMQYEQIHLPAGSSWIVQTDIVSHAALSGQYLLEQTFYLPIAGMKNPQHSPLKILERILGRNLL
jgi:hypothetical protein